jgi:hypothetical protein
MKKTIHFLQTYNMNGGSRIYAEYLWPKNVKEPH